MTISPYVDSAKLDVMTGWVVLSTHTLTDCQNREAEAHNFCIDVMIWRLARASQMGSSSMVSSLSSGGEVVAVTEPIWSSCHIRAMFVLFVCFIQAFAVFRISSCTYQSVALVLLHVVTCWTSATILLIVALSPRVCTRHVVVV